MAQNFRSANEKLVLSKFLRDKEGARWLHSFPPPSSSRKFSQCDLTNTYKCTCTIPFGSRDCIEDLIFKKNQLPKIIPPQALDYLLKCAFKPAKFSR